MYSTIACTTFKIMARADMPETGMPQLYRDLSLMTVQTKSRRADRTPFLKLNPCPRLQAAVAIKVTVIRSRHARRMTILHIRDHGLQELMLNTLKSTK